MALPSLTNVVNLPFGEVFFDQMSYSYQFKVDMNTYKQYGVHYFNRLQAYLDTQARIGYLSDEGYGQILNSAYKQIKELEESKRVYEFSADGRVVAEYTGYGYHPDYIYNSTTSSNTSYYPQWGTTTNKLEIKMPKAQVWEDEINEVGKTISDALSGKKSKTKKSKVIERLDKDIESVTSYGRELLDAVAA